MRMLVHNILDGCADVFLINNQVRTDNTEYTSYMAEETNEVYLYCSHTHTKIAACNHHIPLGKVIENKHREHLIDVRESEREPVICSVIKASWIFAAELRMEVMQVPIE